MVVRLYSQYVRGFPTGEGKGRISRYLHNEVQPLVLKKMLDIVMNVDNAALCSLTEGLQKLRIKDVPGGKVGTMVSYLKGALLLLQNCAAIPTETMGLLNNVMSFADCKDFTDYMNSIYFSSKRTNTMGDYMC